MSNWMSPGRPAARVWAVGALVQAIADSLTARFSTVMVRGEIGGFTRVASGHGYFTLKDENGGAALRCAIFRRALSQVDFAPAEGMLVEARGNLSVYEARGELQLVVEGLTRAGAGALFEQFLRLKAKLEAEGLFSPESKRALSLYPSRVAVVTSLGAAALHDVLSALRRRAPHVEVIVAPCAVQGAEAPAQIVQAIHDVQFLHQHGCKVDAIIVCRGGGSIEDLWAFNDERVVRAVAASKLPVVSGVGHETDFTLTDFAADARAPTPTAAAEFVSRDRSDLLGELSSIEQTLRYRLVRQLDSAAQTLDQLASRLRAPAQVVSGQQQALSVLAHRLSDSLRSRIKWDRQALPALSKRLDRSLTQQWLTASQECRSLDSRLQSVNPQRVLERGYAWISDQQGLPLSSVKQAAVGAPLKAVMVDGQLDVAVVSVHTKPDLIP